MNTNKQDEQGGGAMTVVPGTYGDSYITNDGFKAFIGAGGTWFARKLDEPYPCAANFASAQEAIRAARSFRPTP